MTDRRISQPIYCKLTSCSSPTIPESHNLIITSNSMYTIDQLLLIVLKNLVHILKYSILYLISKSLDDGIMDTFLKYAIIKPVLKKHITRS